MRGARFHITSTIDGRQWQQQQLLPHAQPTNANAAFRFVSLCLCNDFVPVCAIQIERLAKRSICRAKCVKKACSVVKRAESAARKRREREREEKKV